MNEIGSYISTFLREFENYILVKYLRIDWNDLPGKEMQGNLHMPLPYFIFRYSILRLKLQCLFVSAPLIVDVGSGSGKILWMLSTITETKLSGIEIEPAFCEKSKSNLNSLGVDATIFCGDVLDYRWSNSKSQKIILTLFNPLPNETLRSFLSILCQEKLNVVIIFFWDIDALTILNGSGMRLISRSKLIRTSVWEF